MPTVYRFKGYRFFFFANEGHEPPHIHLEKAEDYAKFWLTPVELVESVGFNASELTKLREIIVEKREAFLEEWHEFFSHKTR